MRSGSTLFVRASSTDTANGTSTTRFSVKAGIDVFSQTKWITHHATSVEISIQQLTKLVAPAVVFLVQIILQA
jgi:hypothetical protein